MSVVPAKGRPCGGLHQAESGNRHEARRRQQRRILCTGGRSGCCQEGHHSLPVKQEGFGSSAACSWCLVRCCAFFVEFVLFVRPLSPGIEISTVCRRW